MTIFRGVGGGGNSTTDSEITELTSLALQAATSAEQAGLEADAAAVSAAAASGSAASSASSAAAALASETEAALSESAAAISASNSLASENAAAINASTATTGASTATTQAGLAVVSAAAALVSEGNAATSASTATTQAGIATNGASTATTQAGIATTQAAASLTSANNSANSANTAGTARDQAVAAYDNFDDRYLGPKASAPTLDNDGNALLVGALYFNTGGNTMHVYAGTSWVLVAMTSDSVLQVVNNLSDVLNVAASRTNLGLGTIATQAASAVAITGGAIDGVAIGATTRSTAKVTSLDATGAVSLPSSTASVVPLHIGSGTTPTALVNGDIWVESTGLFVKNNTYAHQLDIDSNTSGTLNRTSITITGGGSTFSVSSVEAFLYSQTTFSGDFKKFVIPAATGLPLTDNVPTYLAISYNAGNPVFVTTTDVSFLNGSDYVGAALLFRVGSTVHYTPVNWGLAPASKLNRRAVQTDRYRRSSGLALSESTGRVIELTSGIIWYGSADYSEGASSSTASNAEFWYNVAGAWTKSLVSTYNNTQYDTGTDLATLSGGRYAVNWVYRYIGTDGQPTLAYILGSGNYTLGQAQASASPTPPPILASMAVLVGRIIVVKNAATANQIDSAFTVVFAGTTVANHNDLANLQGGAALEYYHLTAAEYTGTGTGTFVRATSPTLVTPILGTASLTSATFPDLSVQNTAAIGFGFKNRIINGTFAINQRAVTGTVVLSAGVYGHDRFKAGASGCTYTFATSANVTTITISAGSLVQVVEGINLQSGTYVLSWVGTVQGKINGGSYAASGLTGTATGGTNLTVEFSTGSLSSAQLEKGSTATAYDFRDHGRELIMCQRYLPMMFTNAVFGLTGQCFSSSSVLVAFPFKVTPRVAPTGLVASAASGGSLSTATAGQVATSSIAFYGAGTDYCCLILGVATTPFVAGNATTFATPTTTIQFTGCEL